MPLFTNNRRLSGCFLIGSLMLFSQPNRSMNKITIRFAAVLTSLLFVIIKYFNGLICFKTAYFYTRRGLNEQEKRILSRLSSLYSRYYLLDFEVLYLNRLTFRFNRMSLNALKITMLIETSLHLRRFLFGICWLANVVTQLVSVHCMGIGERIYIVAYHI